MGELEASGNCFVITRIFDNRLTSVSDAEDERMDKTATQFFMEILSNQKDFFPPFSPFLALIEPFTSFPTSSAEKWCKSDNVQSALNVSSLNFKDSEAINPST